jgi:DNA-binding CsgD family transcriptional regulator
MARSRTFEEFNRGSEKGSQAKGRSLEAAVDRIELLRSRVGFLKGKDGALMKIYLENAGTFRQMARIAGVNESNIARHIHKLIRRLLDGQYIECLRNREEFTQEQIEIARDYFVDGLPMSEIADRREITYYYVRKTMKKIQRMTAAKS